MLQMANEYKNIFVEWYIHLKVFLGDKEILSILEFCPS